MNPKSYRPAWRTDKGCRPRPGALVGAPRRAVGVGAIAADEPDSRAILYARIRQPSTFPS
jgi:hypothetical protein